MARPSSRSLEIVRDASGWQIEQSDDSATSHLRIVPAARVGRRPARPLPTLQSLQLRAFVQGHDKVELAIGVAVILAAEHVAITLVLEATRIGAIHVHGGDAELERLGSWLQDTAAPVIRSVDLLVCRPSLLNSDFNQAAQILIERALLAIFLVEPALHLGAGRHILDLPQERNTALN